MQRHRSFRPVSLRGAQWFRWLQGCGREGGREGGGREGLQWVQGCGRKGTLVGPGMRQGGSFFGSRVAGGRSYSGCRAVKGKVFWWIQGCGREGLWWSLQGDPGASELTGRAGVSADPRVSPALEEILTW